MRKLRTYVREKRREGTGKEKDRGEKRKVPDIERRGCWKELPLCCRQQRPVCERG